MDSPQVKALMARLNAQLFQIHSRYERTISVGQPDETEDEDAFSRAFQEQVVIGTFSDILWFIPSWPLSQGENESNNAPSQPTINFPPHPPSVPIDDNPMTSASNIPTPSLPAGPGEPLDASNDGVDPPAAKRPLKKKTTRGRSKRVGNKAA